MIEDARHYRAKLFTETDQDWKVAEAGVSVSAGREVLCCLLQAAALTWLIGPWRYSHLPPSSPDLSSLFGGSGPIQIVNRAAAKSAPSIAAAPAPFTSTMVPFVGS